MNDRIYEMRQMPPSTAPANKPVLIAGGVAMKSREGFWYSGMSEPLFRRQLEWEPEWWAWIPRQNDKISTPPAPAPSMDCICGGTAVRREQEGWHWIECAACRRRTSGAWNATGAAGAWDRVHTPKPCADASNGGNRGEAQAQPGAMDQAQREGGDV